MSKQLEWQTPVVDDGTEDWEIFVSPDIRFIVKRLKAAPGQAADPKIFDDVYHRALIDLLRNYRPSWGTLQIVARELEQLYWPKKYKKRNREQVFLTHAALLQSHLETLYREQGKVNPGTLAERVTAKNFGIGVGGLQQNRYRYRKRKRAGL